MTISLSDNDPRISYSVSAGVTQSTFTVPFEFFDLDDLNVYVDGTQKTKTTHYALASGGSGATGSITMTVTGAAGGSTVVITRAIDHERTTDFQTSGPFNIASLNTELDRFTAIAADLKDDIDRSLRLTDFDSDVALTLPDVNSRKGKVLAFNASTGAVEAGPSTSDVQTVSATAADIAALADIEDGTTATDAISGLAAIKANVTTVAGIASNVTSVAGNATNINAVAGDATDIGIVASNISDINDVAAKTPLITSDFISDLNTVAVTDVINDINTLATSDIVADLNTLATTDIVADLNTLATTDIVNDINTLATTDIVNDLNLLATSDFVADLNTMATTTNVNNLSTVSTNISAVSTAASSISEITSFNDLFSVSASAPSSPSAGDLWYDTANSQLKVYVTGSGWQVAGAYLQGLTSTHVFTCTANQTSLTTDDDGNTLSIYSNGNTLVFMNGVRLVEGSGSGVNDYYISGNTINLNSNSDAGDVVLVEVFTKISTTQEASLNSLVSQASTSASNAATSESNAATSATDSANSATASASSASSASTSAATSTTQASAASTSASNAATSESNAAASATAAASSAAAAQAAANFEVVNDTTPQLSGDLDTNGNNINFGDNDKAQFGASNDLQIYHDGSNSIIKDAGTGNIEITGRTQVKNTNGELMGDFVQNGPVDLYYDNAKKFETTSTGIAVTGNIGVGGTETSLFNGVGGSMKAVVIGDDSATAITNNSDAGIAIVNTNQTAGNLAGLHFARADTDDSPNYAGASIVAQFPDAQVTGQYPKGEIAFLTSTAANTAPSEKMRIAANGDVTVSGGVTADTVTLDNGANDWQFSVDGSNNLIISIAGTAKAKLDGSGNLTVVGNVTAFGTI